jgi:hypothetical protein
MDFNIIKQWVPTEEAIPMLGLQMRRVKPTEWRGRCPFCKRGDDRSLCITQGKGFTCFAGKPWATGKSVLDLVCHIRGLDPKKEVRKAAEEVVAHFNITFPSTSSPKPPTAKEPAKRSDMPSAPQKTLAEKLAEVRTSLIYAHPLLEQMGLAADVAQAVGIGFAVRGTKGNRVLIPVYKDGELIDYIGWNPEKDPVFLVSPNIVERL